MESLKAIWIAVLVACAALLAPAAWAESPRDDVTAAYAAWDAAFNKGDAKAIADAYTDDAVFLPATSDVIKGRAGVEKFFTAILALGVTGHKQEVIEVRAEANFIIAAARWSADGKVRALTSLGTGSRRMCSSNSPMAA